MYLLLNCINLYQLFLHQNSSKHLQWTHEAGNCHWKQLTSGHFVSPNGCHCEGIQQNWKHPMTLKPNWKFIFVSMSCLHFLNFSLFHYRVIFLTFSLLGENYVYIHDVFVIWSICQFLCCIQSAFHTLYLFLNNSILDILVYSQAYFNYHV